MPEAERGPFSPAEDAALLAKIAPEAGAIALSYWQKSPESWMKPGDAGPVSEADLAVDSFLKSRLCAARPDYGWLSEESPDDPVRLSHTRVFIIDPIDGTSAYLAGEEAFAISLAVAEAGRIIAAQVYLPARNISYAAHADGPATRDGTVIQASTRPALAGATVLANRASLNPELWPNGLPDLKQSFRSSLAWRFCRTAEGREDAMVTLRDTWEWDSAAGSLIAERAGCMVSDKTGARLRFNQPDPRAPGVIVAPPVLHAGFMAGLGSG